MRGRTSKKNGDAVAVNTEDKEMCGNCDKLITTPVNNDGKENYLLECEICAKWFHTICENVPDEQFKVIEKYNVHWYCSKCDGAAKQLHEEVIALRLANNQLKQDLTLLDGKVKNLETSKVSKTECKQVVVSQLDEVKDQWKSDLKAEVKAELKNELKIELKNEIKEDIQADVPVDEIQQPEAPWNLVGGNRRTPNLREIINDQMREQQQVELVKKNLVITGIPEINPAEDMQKAKDIIQQNLNITAEIVKVERCGKPDRDATRPRLLKLFLNSLDNRKNILRNATKLRDSDDAHTAANVYINPDLTWKQQQEAKNLKRQLDQKRLEDTTKTFKIKRGVIIEVQ